MNSSYEEFLKKPTMYGLDQVIAQKRNSPSLSKMPVYRFAEECEVWRNYGHSVKVQLSGYDFCGRFKCDYRDVDFYVEFRVGDQRVFALRKENIGGSDRNCPADISRIFTRHQLNKDVRIDSLDQAIKVGFRNETGINQWSGLYPRDFYSILAHASERGGVSTEAFYSVKELAAGQQPSSVTFTFSGLPYVK